MAMYCEDVDESCGQLIGAQLQNLILFQMAGSDLMFEALNNLVLTEGREIFPRITVPW